jgi:hypothetical protein
LFLWQLIKKETANIGAGGDWTNITEAVAVSHTNRSCSGPAYVFSGDAYLYGTAGICRLVVITRPGLLPPAGNPSPEKCSLDILLAHGQPSVLLGEVCGLPANVTVQIGGQPFIANAAADRIPFGGKAGTPVLLNEFPRRCKIESIAVRVEDSWGNLVQNVLEPAARSRSRGSALEPTLELALESEGAGLLLGENPPSDALPSNRHIAVAPLPRDGASGAAHLNTAEFLKVHVFAEGNAIDARILITCTLPAGNKTASDSAAPSELETKLSAEVELRLANTNRVLRVITSPGPFGIKHIVRAGEKIGKLIASVETEDGNGFTGSSRTLIRSLAAKCTFIPAATAPRQDVESEVPFIPYVENQAENDCDSSDNYGTAEQAAKSVYFSAAHAWISGDYTILVHYTEQREALVSSLRPCELSICSVDLNFQVSFTERLQFESISTPSLYILLSSLQGCILAD